MNTPRRANDYEGSAESIKAKDGKESEIIRLTRLQPQKRVNYFTRF